MDFKTHTDSINLKKIAIVGTNGLPAKYGGFETLVEYLVKYLSSQFKLLFLFCCNL